MSSLLRNWPGWKVTRTMNNKQKIGPKRYKPMVDRPNWERLDEFTIGRSVLTHGRSVKITGQRAATFEFMYAERNLETGDVVLAFVGGRTGHRLSRFFKPEQVAKVLRW